MPEQHRNHAREYLDAVEVLTQPHQAPIIGPDGAFHGVRLAAPALQVLQRDCAAGIMRGGGTGSEAHTRTPLNVGAADLLGAIRKAVLHDYGVLVGGGGRPDVIPALVAVRLPVLNGWRSGKVTTGELIRRTHQAKGWARAISDLLDPPMRVEVTEPCPRCGERWVLKGDDSVGALSTTYRDVHTAITACAHCKAEWLGIEGARRLRIELDATARMQALLLSA